MNNLVALLNKSSEEERLSFALFVGAIDSSNGAIKSAIWKKSTNLFQKAKGAKPTYNNILRRVADKLKIKIYKWESAESIEIKICQKVIETALDQMSDYQIEQLEKELYKESKKFGKKYELIESAGILSSLTAAQLSGFGVYLLASTSLAFVASGIGIALPFAIYTAMSEVISFVIGPAGWIGLGLYSVWRLTSPNYRRLTSMIIYITIIRAKVKLQLS